VECNAETQEEETNSILPNINETLPANTASMMVVILILLESFLKSKEHKTKVSMIKAYQFALLCHFITKFLTDAYFYLFGPESVQELFSSDAKNLNSEHAMKIQI